MKKENNECHMPEVKEKHGGRCNDEQVLKCHGKKFLEELMQEEVE